MPIFFHLDIIEIYDQIKDKTKCGVDSYGKPHKCIQLRTIVDGDLQTASAGESKHPFGTKINNTHKLYLDTDVEVRSTDILKVMGYRGVFKVVGDPQIFNKLIPHQLISLQHIPEERMVRVS